MYRIRMQSGETSEFGSFEELSFGIVSGIIHAEDEIYHARAEKWLPIKVHPDYKRAAAQVPPPSPTTTTTNQPEPPPPPSASEVSEEHGGLDLMTLLDLEELTAYDPGKVQESAPLEEAESAADSGDFEPIELGSEASSTNGHGSAVHQEIDPAEEPAAHEDEAPEPANLDLDSADEVPPAEEPVEDASPADEEPQLSVVDTTVEETTADETDEDLGLDRSSEEDAIALGVVKDTVLDEDKSIPDAEASDEVELEELFADDDGSESVDFSEELDQLEPEPEPEPEPDPVVAIVEAPEDVTAEEDLDEAAADEVATEGPEPSRATIGSGGKDIDYIAAEDTEDQPIMAQVAHGEITDDYPEPPAAVVEPAVVASLPPKADDDPFRDTFSPVHTMARPQRRALPVVPAGIAAGVIAMAVLGWLVMGSGSSEEPGPEVQPETPPAVQVTPPAATPDLSQQSLAAEDPAEEVQRRYLAAHTGARTRLDADLRSAGFSNVFARSKFADEASLRAARATVAAAGAAVRLYRGRVEEIDSEFPEADPTEKETRSHRELAEDLLSVSDGIYGVLLGNTASVVMRNDALTITDQGVEANYSRLVGELDRLLALAEGLADDERATTVRRITRGIGSTRPPPLAELAPPPALPSDL